MWSTPGCIRCWGRSAPLWDPCRPGVLYGPSGGAAERRSVDSLPRGKTLQTRGVAQPGSAPEWGSGGRRFKSSRPDQYLRSASPVRLRIGGRLDSWRNRDADFPVPTSVGLRGRPVGKLDTRRGTPAPLWALVADVREPARNASCTELTRAFLVIPTNCRRPSRQHAHVL